MPVAPKEYTIEGRTFTANSLAKKLNCGSESARTRLKKCKTLEELFKPVRQPGEGSFKKEYIIEGKTLTAYQVAKVLGCSVGTARRRLIIFNTLKEVYAPVGAYSESTEQKEWKSGNEHNRKLTDMTTPLNKLLFGKW